MITFLKTIQILNPFQINLMLIKKLICLKLWLLKKYKKSINQFKRIWILNAKLNLI